MFTVVIALAIIVCALLILVILAQNPKGGGLSSQFGGSGTSQIMGVKKTTDLLEKITWTLAITLFFLSLSTKLIISNSTDTGFSSPNVERAQESAVTPNFSQQDLSAPQGQDQPSGEGQSATSDADADLLDQLSGDDQSENADQ